MTYWQLLLTLPTCLIVLTTPLVSVAGFKEDIGLTALLAELGGSAPTGAGIGISQVEGLDVGNYPATATDPELTGKTVTLKSGASGVSGHAVFVARSFCGSTNGIAPGMTQIDAYKVNNWLGTGFLRSGNSNAAPLVESRRIQNHSWIGTTSDQLDDEEILRRFDYAIQQDGFVAIVGLNNGNLNPLPELLAHSYNSISVGLPGGNHSAGLTTNEVAHFARGERSVPRTTKVPQ